MLTTKNAIYMHSPKTGGTWVREVLSPIKVSWSEHDILESPPNVPVYSFVRNPLDWHVSMYHFLNNGSEYFKQNSILPIIHALPHNTFEDFVQNVCSPSKEFKNRVHAIFKVMISAKQFPHITDIVEGKIIKAWLDTDVGYYQLINSIYSRYTTSVGKYENLREELLRMTAEAGDLTDELKIRIETTMPINVTALEQSKSSFYTAHTVSLVKESCQDIIKEYNYEF